MKKWLSENRHALWALCLPLYLVCFFLTEKLVPEDSQVWDPTIPADYDIPFVPQFIIFYCAWYVGLFAVGLWLMFKDGRGFRRFMIFIFSTFMLSLIFCLLVPNGIELREPITGTDIFSRAVVLLRQIDTPTNVFPSMHVIGSVGIVLGVFYTDTIKSAWLKAASVIVAVGICASTVFLRQHALLDIAGGLAFALAGWVFVYLLPDLRAKRKNTSEKSLKSE